MADLTGLGAVADLAGDLVKRWFPDKSEQERAQMAAALQIIQGQLDANKAEAASPSVFVSGWRPFVGWCCGAGCAWNWVGLPVAQFGLALWGSPIVLKPADLSEMMPLLVALLGLGAYRSFEKVNKVAR